MADDLLDLYRRRTPELYATALEQLEQRAREGDQGLRARLEHMAALPVVSLVRLEGEGGGELWMLAARDELRVSSQAPPAGFGYALAISVNVARHGLSLLSRDGVDVSEAARGLTLLASSSARELFSGITFGFELEVSNTPELGTVRAQLSLGRPVLAARPDFKLTVDYDELEDARDQGLTAHQLFLAGKIKIEGDVAKAMLLGMTLAQLR
jgi:hypothetical protein